MRRRNINPGIKNIYPFHFLFSLVFFNFQSDDYRLEASFVNYSAESSLSSQHLQPPVMCEGGVGDKGTSCRPLSKLISPGIQNSHSHQNILFTFEQRKYLVHNKWTELWFPVKIKQLKVIEILTEIMDAVSIPLPAVTAWLIFTMTQIILDSQDTNLLMIIFLFLTL